MTEQSMRGRAAVITGAAGGIGAAIARRFASAGASVAILDRDAEGAQRLAQELNAAGHTALGIGCDVTAEDQCHDAMRRVHDEFGRIDILVNNAGITHLSRFADTDVSVLRRVMDVNLFGAVHCTQAALPWLRESKGSVVLLSSVAGFGPLAGRCGYSASKHALHGMFESMRTEVQEDGVHVMMVCPSFTKTKIGEHALSGRGGAPKAPRTEYGTPAEPESVAEAIYQGVLRRRRMIVLETVGKLSYLMTRFLPGTYERMMAKRLMLD